MIRLIFWMLCVYFGFKLLSKFIAGSVRKVSKVDDSSEDRSSLDLSGEDIEDADFEDIP